MRTYTETIRDYEVPDSSFTIYSEGEHCNNADPGDLVLIRHRGKFPFIIRLGQRIYYWRKRFIGHPEYDSDFCKFNHAAVVVEGGEGTYIVEMQAKGGVKSSLKDYVAQEYAVIKLTADDNQKQDAVDFANYCLNIEYGYISIVAIAINILIGWGISLSTRGLICSAATSLSARCMGLIPDGPDITVMPADLARYFKVR